ncbi:MAG: PTS sugar transporter subunit IIC, partial [Candidatus Eremiobacteraeota bacterium]|nr:PTS sugar transporter subunit IIC [Candidatus Eremiobacteraeota bacterium]
MKIGLTGFNRWLEKKLLPPLMKLAAQKSLIAVQKGIIYCIPVLIIFLIFFLVLFPITDFNSRFMESFRAALFITSPVASFIIAYKLGEHWKTGKYISGIIGILLFIVTLPFFTYQSSLYGFITHISSMSLIAAVIFGMAASYYYRYLYIKKKIKRIPTIMLSIFFILLIGAIIQYFELNIYAGLDMIFTPILIAGDSLPGMLAVIIIICILWMGGVNGGIAIAPIIAPLYLGMLAANTSAFQSGQENLPYIVTPPFFNFVFQGGSGCTLPLVFMMLFSRIKKIRRLGKISLIPSIFNINDLVIYSIPIVMNPVLWPPFLLVPCILGIITYTAMYFDLVSKVIYYIPGILPGVVIAYLSTGGDYRAIILALINLIIGAFIYYPFFIVYEKIKAKESDDEK